MNIKLKELECILQPIDIINWLLGMFRIYAYAKFLLWDFASDFIGLDDGNDEAFENVVQI